MADVTLSTEMSVDIARQQRIEYLREYRRKNADVIRAKEQERAQSPDRIAWRKENYAKNRERFAANAKVSRSKHKDKTSERNSRYYLENKEQLQESMREYRKNNFDILKEKKHAYINANRELVQARKADWYLRNKEYMKAKRLFNREKKDLYVKATKEARKKQAAAWHAKNRDSVNARKAIYFKENPEIYAASRNNRRTRVLQAEGAHSASDLRTIKLAQKNRCAYCRQKLLRSSHLDHIVPLSKGGSNWPSNLQYLCQSCNLQKGSKDPIEYARDTGRLL